MPEWLSSGDHASRPAASAVAVGALYACSDHDLIYQSDGSSWSTWSDVSGSGAGATNLASTVYTRTAGNYTTTSGTFTDIDGTNLSRSITTGARRCLVTLAGSMGNSTAVFHAIDLLIDGTSVTGGAGIVSGNGAIISNCSFSFLTDVLTAASHTFKLQFKTSAGTMTVYGAGSGGTALRFAVHELYAA